MHVLAGILGGSSLVSGNIVPWAPTSRVYPVDAPVDTPPIVLLPGFGNCSADYENPYGSPNESMAAVLRVRAIGDRSSLWTLHPRCAHVISRTGLQDGSAETSKVLLYGRPSKVSNFCACAAREGASRCMWCNWSARIG